MHAICVTKSAILVRVVNTKLSIHRPCLKSCAEWKIHQLLQTQSQHGLNSRWLLQWWPFLTNFQHQTSFITNAAHSRTAPSSFLPALKHLTFGIPEPGHWPDLMVSWMLVSATHSLLWTCKPYLTCIDVTIRSMQFVSLHMQEIGFSSMSSSMLTSLRSASVSSVTPPLPSLWLVSAQPRNFDVVGLDVNIGSFLCKH